MKKSCFSLFFSPFFFVPLRTNLTNKRVFLYEDEAKIIIRCLIPNRSD